MTQQRLSLSSMIAAAAAVAALGLPGMASAAYEHPANNEIGVIVHSEHFKSPESVTPPLRCSSQVVDVAKHLLRVDADSASPCG